MSKKCIIEKYLHKARFCGDKTIEVPYNDLTMMCHLALDSLQTSRWIPVSERLPTEDDSDENGYVLVWNKNGRGTWNWRDVVFHNHIVKITHWMPFPEPPKEVE